MSEHVVGLRFAAKDLKRLQKKADEFKADGTYTHMIGVLERAAKATALGDPLIFYASSLDEVEAWADGMTLYGISRPVVEAVQAP